MYPSGKDKDKDKDRRCTLQVKTKTKTNTKTYTNVEDAPFRWRGNIHFKWRHRNECIQLHNASRWYYTLKGQRFTLEKKIYKFSQDQRALHMHIMQVPNLSVSPKIVLSLSSVKLLRSNPLSTGNLKCSPRKDFRALSKQDLFYKTAALFRIGRQRKYLSLAALV